MKKTKPISRHNTQIKTIKKSLIMSCNYGGSLIKRSHMHASTQVKNDHEIFSSLPGLMIPMDVDNDC